MSLRSFAFGLPLLAGLAALSGCAALPGESEDAPLGVAAERIKGGQPDPGDTNVVDVVWFETGAVSECSGSLLGPNLVLTARHCVSEIINGSQGIDCSVSSFAKHDSPGNFWVSTAQFLPMDQTTFQQEFVGVQEVITPTPTGVCGNDIAMFILATPITANQAIPLIPRVDSDIAKGDLYSAVGFGGTVQDGTGAGQRRRLDKLLVDCVGSKCPAEFLAAISAQTEWVGDHGICEGDSGGPSLDGDGRVIGVTSRGGADCSNPVYGSVFGWADLIKQTALHAAQVGNYDAPGWAMGNSTDPKYNFPVGDACGTPPTCTSGLCLGDAMGNYCTRECADDGPCPTGYACNDVNGTKLCERPPPASSSSTGSSSSSGGTVGQKSGCSAEGADPTKPVPWATGTAIAAMGLALLRRRRRRTTVRG